MDDVLDLDEPEMEEEAEGEVEKIILELTSGLVMVIHIYIKVY